MKINLYWELDSLFSISAGSWVASPEPVAQSCHTSLFSCLVQALVLTTVLQNASPRFFRGQHEFLSPQQIACLADVTQGEEDVGETAADAHGHVAAVGRAGVA